MNNDIISRSALKKAMVEERRYLLNRGQICAEHILVHHCLPLIDNAPPVEVPTELCKGCRFLQDCETCEEKLRPQGEWIELKTNPPLLNHKFYICSLCNREIDVMLPEDSLEDYPYCHCGADMRGGGKQ